MQPLSPLDAVSPAFRRIQQIVLPRPRRWGRAWKLCACSYLASLGSLFLPLPIFLLAAPRDSFPVALTPVIAYAAAGFLLVLLVIFYCGVRMEFVEFEVVASGATRIGPIWRRYGSRTVTWFFIKLIAGVIVFLAFLPLAHSVIGAFIAFAHAPGSSQMEPDAVLPGFSLFVHAVLGFYALFAGTFFVLKAFSTVLHDLVLPFYALEEIPLSVAMRKGWAICTAEPGQVILYFFLKPLLTLVGLIGAQLLMYVCFIPLVLLVFVLAFGGAFLLTATHSPAVHMLIVAAGVLLYAAAYGCFVAVVIGLIGYVMNLLEAYGVFFLASRYARLAELLYGAPSAPFTPPPPPPRPGPDGPSLPMNPALA